MTAPDDRAAGARVTPPASTHRGSRTDPDSGAGVRVWLRRALLSGVVVLYVASVPWYRETGSEVHLVLGLPDWVAVALGCYVGVALLNCAAWLLTDVRDPDAPKRPVSGAKPAISSEEES